MPAAGPRGAQRGHQRPTKGGQGPVSAPNCVEYWRDRLPACRHCYFRSNFKTVSLGTKLNEASMVTLTHVFFFLFNLQFGLVCLYLTGVDWSDSHLNAVVALFGRLLLNLLGRLVLEGRRGLLENGSLLAALEQGGDEAG